MDRHKAVRWLCWIAFVAASLLILVLVTPYLVSAYHLEAGGRALDNPEFLAYNPLPALAHLQKAIEWEPDNAQAYRLMGKVYRAQGDWVAAAEALTRYTELRPDNPLGHIELAEVYEVIEAEMRTMHLADLVAALPEAAVEAPNVPLDTPYTRPDGPAWHSYVAATTFSLPPNFGERPTLFMHSPSWVTYTLVLPAQPAMLRFGVGMDPQTHNWPGDGATFEVFVNGERFFLEHVDKAKARQGWHERTVDLASWAGGEVALALAVTPGPAADPSGDWAGWGEPQVVDARLPAMEVLHPGARLLDEWQRAGLTTEAFIVRVEEARKAGRYEEALAWYERGKIFDPQLSYMDQSGGNLIVNPGFEYGSLGWYKLQVDSSIFQVEPCEDRTGNCAVLEGLTQGYHGGWYQVVRLVAGKQYRYSLWIKTGNAGDLEGRVLYAQASQGAKPVGIGGVEFRGSTGWSYRETVFTAPVSDDRLIQVYPALANNFGRVWIDDVQLSPIDQE